MADQERNSVKDTLIILLLIPYIILALLLLPFIGIYLFLKGMWLGFLVKLLWYPKGKCLLFVYSDSPNWKDHIETNILPKIEKHAVVINWSERSNWDKKIMALELKVFKHWSGATQYKLKGKKKRDGKEYNPIAIVFIPWWKRHVIRFWKPFKDYKHGKHELLMELENELYALLRQTPSQDIV